MKNTLVLALVALSVPAFAAKIKDAKCSDMNTVNENVRPQYMAVVDGYDKAGKKISEEVDMEGIVTESKNVAEHCAKDSGAKLSSVKKDLQSSNMATTNEKNTKLNPTKAKCQDFIAMGEETQPVAVFWVAGHDKSGKIKKGEVDEEFLSQPIMTLVEDCKAHPTASFYDRTKAWLKKKL